MGIKNTKEEFSDVSSDSDMIKYVEKYNSDHEFYFDTLFLGENVSPKRNYCTCFNR